MISLGGVIGAGLFVGSSAAIAGSGPGVLLSYLLAGTVALLVMRMLGEMAIDAPAAGSFIGHVRRGLGARAAFVAGWIYWLFWAVVVAAEAIGGSAILEAWIPLPRTVLDLLLVLAMTATNLVSVTQLRRVRVLVLRHQDPGHRAVLRPLPGGTRRRVRARARQRRQPLERRRLPRARARRGAGDHPHHRVPVYRVRDRHRGGGGVRRSRPQRRPRHQHRGAAGAAVLRELGRADPLRGAVAAAGAWDTRRSWRRWTGSASPGRRPPWRSSCWWRCCPASTRRSTSPRG